MESQVQPWSAAPWDTAPHNLGFCFLLELSQKWLEILSREDMWRLVTVCDQRGSSDAAGPLLQAPTGWRAPLEHHSPAETGTSAGQVCTAVSVVRHLKARVGHKLG